jgi:hypothetical protein
MQNSVHDKSTIPQRSIGQVPLKRGGVILLLAILFLMAPFANLAFSGVPSSFRIIIGTFFPYYSPEFVHIGTGTSVSWENPTSDLHSITHDDCKAGGRCAFDSGPLGPNGKFTVRHLPPGEYPYHCSFHPIMRGVLVVTESGAPSET